MSSATQIGKVAVQTTRFGLIEVDEELIIELPRGMIGFEDCRRFVVVNQDPSNVLRWFQSLDDGSVAFPIMDPYAYDPRYSPTISPSDAEEIGLDEDTPRLVFAVVTIPRDDPAGLTVNLLGPILINARTRVGKQVVVSDECYKTKHRILTSPLAAVKR